jgi:hypothetical protein
MIPDSACAFRYGRIIAGSVSVRSAPEPRNNPAHAPPFSRLNPAGKPVQDMRHLVRRQTLFLTLSPLLAGA